MVFRMIFVTVCRLKSMAMVAMVCEEKPKSMISTQQQSSKLISAPEASSAFCEILSFLM